MEYVINEYKEGKKVIWNLPDEIWEFLEEGCVIPGEGRHYYFSILVLERFYDSRFAHPIEKFKDLPDHVKDWFLEHLYRFMDIKDHSELKDMESGNWDCLQDVIRDAKKRRDELGREV